MPASFRVLDFVSGASPRTFDGLERVAPPDADTTRWIDLAEPDVASLELLRERFRFHPLAIEDCAHLDQRPKLEEYGDHLFLVTQGFTCPGVRVKDLVLHEIHAFLGERYLVTVHADAVPALEEVWQRASAEPGTLERGADFAYYLLGDALVDSNFPILDRIADELEELEENVLKTPTREDLARTLELKRHLVTMRKVLSPQRDTMAMLARRGHARVSERTSLYFRDVYDHLSRINESIETNRDLLSSALEAYLSAVSNRTNEIMKTLTLLSAVFLPLTFVVGFFGQNFANLPGFPGWMRSDGLSYAMIAVCFATPFVMLLWFRRKRWL